MLTLSKNLTFSLAIVTMLALGFGFTPIASAAKDTEPVPELSTIDVSAAPGNQVEAYNAIGTTGGPDGSASSLPIATESGAVDTQGKIDTLIAEAQASNIQFYIRLHEGVALLDSRGANIDLTSAGLDPPYSASSLYIEDISVSYYGKYGQVLTAPDGGWLANEGSTITHQNTAFPDGRNFLVTINAADISNDAVYAAISLPGGAFQNADLADVAAANADGEQTKMNVAAKFDGNGDGDIADPEDKTVMRLQLVHAEPSDDKPKVVSIVRTVDTVSRADQGAQSIFGSAAVSGPFNVKVTFTEEPDLTKADDKVNYKLDALPFQLENAKITAIVKGTPFYLAPPSTEGNYTADTIPAPSGRDARYHPYLLTLEPTLSNGNDVVIRVKSFNDLVIPPNSYSPPNNLASALNRSVLRVPVHPGAIKQSVADATNTATKGNRDNRRANEVFIPGGLVVPAGGYLVLARGADQAASNVRYVGRNKYKNNDKRERADNQTDIDFKYNVQYGVAFPYPGDNLELFFRNGGDITLRYKDAPDSTTGANNQTGYHGARKADAEGIAEGSLVISEIMWGTDGSATDVNSQWIELHNPGTADVSIDQEEWVLRFDGPTPIRSSHFGLVVDMVGNNPTSGYWQVPGSNGRGATQIESASTLTSMFLKFEAGSAPPTDGTDATNWMASSVRPVINLLGNRIGTPGAHSDYTKPTMDDEEEEEEEEEVVVDVATASDIAISEIMYSVGRGNLPQWIELHNMSAGEVSLKGWNVEIENAGGSDLTITLGATTAKAGQAVLLVSKNGRNSGMGDEEGDLRRVVNLKDLGVTGTLLSSTGFTITLSPPPADGSSVRKDGDVAGGMDWDLPMMDGDRSSLIRETDAGGVYKDGTMRMSWHPTSSTGRYGTYYGHPSDTGTPGYVKGGALPVELSMFYPARNKLTGQVVITWETQSELNNAGFFVKRSTARKGPFTVINPTMIAGAGTTSEKQSYTYTDTTAQPNVIYFYQIEDVSLDGKRATLTNAHRLRGHIGAAGKVTTIWGELKSQE